MSTDNTSYQHHTQAIYTHACSIAKSLHSNEIPIITLTNLIHKAKIPTRYTYNTHKEQSIISYNNTLDILAKTYQDICTKQQCTSILLPVVHIYIKMMIRNMNTHTTTTPHTR